MIFEGPIQRNQNVVYVCPCVVQITQQIIHYALEDVRCGADAHRQRPVTILAACNHSGAQLLRSFIERDVIITHTKIDGGSIFKTLQSVKQVEDFG